MSSQHGPVCIRWFLYLRVTEDLVWQRSFHSICQIFLAWFRKDSFSHRLAIYCIHRSNTLSNDFLGIRPLVRDPNASNTESLVRNHLIAVSESGLLTCVGGKGTTYRQMAEEAVDEAIKLYHLLPRGLNRLPDISGGIDSPNDALTLNGTCQTRKVRLVGAHGYSQTLFVNLIQRFGLDVDIAKHLAHSYGDRAWEVAALERESYTAPNTTRGQRLAPTYPFIKSEVRYAIKSEYAQTAIDVLARRTRLSFLNVQVALEALPVVIDIMGEVLQWSDARKEFEWADAVHFLGSMGLPLSKSNITRAEVLTKG